MYGVGRTKCLYILCGPSGSGKSMVGKVLSQLDFRESISYTTRKRRDTEDKGAYHFITREQFAEMLDTGKFIEWAEYAGSLYGTTFDELDQSDYAILELEGLGLVASKYCARPLFVIGLGASRTTLERRLRRRPDKSIERIEADLTIFKDLPLIADLYLTGLSKMATVLEILKFIENCERNMGAMV